MPNPLRDFFFGNSTPKKDLTTALTPRRSFGDVILPANTRKQLEHALVQIKKHDLIFSQWGLGERHNSGMGLAFNFAGPPGTGKTICAEAIAHDLGKRLLVVLYAEMESLWAGETGKNVASVFRLAREVDAVLFFDEADAIASRRFDSVTQGYQREANAVVNVLLKELEEFDGVVIFATNLASNFDPAFERRIRTHILFEMPDGPARSKIWKVQLHARKTPLAPDVDFDFLGETYELSGGDIKNAVLKAAQMASAEPGPDEAKQIHQRHFVAGVEEVLGSKRVMEQSLFGGDGAARQPLDPGMLAGISAGFSQLATNQNAMADDLRLVMERHEAVEIQVAALPEILNEFHESHTAAQLLLREEIVARAQGAELAAMERLGHLEAGLRRLEAATDALSHKVKTAAVLGVCGVVAGVVGLVVAAVMR